MGCNDSDPNPLILSGSPLSQQMHFDVHVMRGSEVAVRFVSDVSNVARGFEITVEARAPGIERNGVTF